MKEKDIRDIGMVKEYLDQESKWISQFVGKDGLIMPEYVRKVACPCCGKNKGKKVFMRNSFMLEECRNCLTMYVNPRFTREMLNKYYRAKESRGKYFEVLSSGRSQENRLKNIFKPRCDYIEKRIKGRLENKCRISLLDIGCASGQFLSALDPKKWSQLNGVEASKDLAMRAQKEIPYAKIINSSFEECVFDPESFDVITLWEVLEHVFDPVQFLKSIGKILKKNGLLFLSTPNVEGFEIQILLDKGLSVYPLSHLNYFRKTTISHLFERGGLTVEEIRTPGKLDVDIVCNFINEYPNEHPVINQRLGLFWYEILKDNSEMGETIRKKLQELISDCGLSSHMMITCYKR